MQQLHEQDPRLDLSIILVSWNSLELTSAALASLQEKTAGIQYEVIVVDNGTTKDASAEELPRRFPWIRMIANPENYGYSRANNQGMRIARGRYVLLLNSDTIQIENAPGEAVRYMDAHPDVGALGILHLNNDEERSVQPSFFSFPHPATEVLGLLGLVKGKSVSRLPEAPPEQDVDWACASFLMLRRECLAEVGGLDERFFVYDEDIDWCRQIWKSGWKIRFWPGASMIHIGAASQPHVLDKTFTHFRSRLTYITKNHSHLVGGIYYLAMAGRLTGATAWQALRYCVRKSTRAELEERFRRQLQFISMRPTRSGISS